MHCRKHISLDIALLVISDWVASCLSDAPIKSFESPVLSPRLLTSAAATGNTSELLTSSSTQDSFETFHSEDSFVSEVAGDAAAGFVDGWGPDQDDLFNIRE
jgi:hypothetical protein